MSYFSLFQSPHPARGATRGEEAAADITDNFNPRTPRGVRRITGLQSLVTQVQFQSTHPARGATTEGRGAIRHINNFNPRTPRGVRLPWTLRPDIWTGPFQSPHPARGATMISTSATSVNKKFQSTHPARGATSILLFAPLGLTISIHAPREGCD